MRNNFLRIAKLVPEKLDHLVWKDESRDTFVLTKFAEIHRFDETQLRLICWNRSIFKKLDKKGLIREKDYTDDGLYMALFNNEDLPKVFNFGIHFRRPRRDGKWLADKKEKLAHDIRRYDGKCQSNRNYNAKFYQKLSPKIKSRIFAHLKPGRKIQQEELL